ncbi:MAG: hypothetical protein U0531_02460 [Dehalococcoidia bacterium]
MIPGEQVTTITRTDGGLRPAGAVAGHGRRRGADLGAPSAGAIVLAREAIGLDRPNIGAMDITVRRNAFGSRIDSFEVDLPILGLGDLPSIGLHPGAGDQARRAGSRGARAAARRPDGGRTSGAVVATSFHPELTGDTRRTKLFLRMVRDTARGPK